MRFRLKAFSIHLLGSFTVLTVVLSALYVGWYYWPGWYLAGAQPVVAILAGVDLALGPLLTLLVANPAKPRRELVRDIGIILIVQIAALGYGSATLWGGRPLYYTFSENRLEIVRDIDIDSADAVEGQKLRPDLAPHWYSLPRWVWAPLPSDTATATGIVGTAISTGKDVINMPRYFRPWQDGLAAMRKQLLPVDRLTLLDQRQKARVKARMSRAGYRPEEAIAMILSGRGTPLVVAVDPASARIQALFRAD